MVTDGVDEENALMNALMNGVVTIDNIWSYIKLSVVNICYSITGRIAIVRQLNTTVSFGF